MSVAIQFTQNFLGAEPECGQVCKFVKEFRPDLLGVRTARIEVPCKLVQVAAYLIVKAQKISKGILLMYVNRRLLRTKFLPLFVQRRCPARSRKV